MKYTRIRLYTSRGYDEALSNLWSTGKCSIVELKNAVEDAKNAKDLLVRLCRMNLLRTILFDRETDAMIRFKCIDGMGIKSYLVVIRPIEKDEKAVTSKWIIAIGNSESDGVRMFYTNGDVDKIKKVLVRLALEDRQSDEEDFDYGTENSSDVEETVDGKTNEVTELNACNVFSDYHIDYTAHRLDSIKPCKA